MPYAMLGTDEESKCKSSSPHSNEIPVDGRLDTSFSMDKVAAVLKSEKKAQLIKLEFAVLVGGKKSGDINKCVMSREWV